MKHRKKILAFIIFCATAPLFVLQAQTVGIKDSTPQATKNNFLTSDEKQLLDKINKLRIESKLPVFEVDSTLTKLAREHSQEMVELKYFDAISPTKGTPKERAAGIIKDYPTLAFVAKGKSTIDVFHTFLLNAQAQEILFTPNKATHVGIGIAKDSIDEILATFHFSNRIVEIESF
jgi:uncharacterized protein YkwD